MTTVAHRLRPDAEAADEVAGLAELLAVLGGTPEFRRERALIVTAILIDAANNNRCVSANRVRLILASEGGNVVRPKLIGVTYAALARAKVLVPIGDERNEDAANSNTGHTIRVWRLAARWCA